MNGDRQSNRGRTRWQTGAAPAAAAAFHDGTDGRSAPPVRLWQVLALILGFEEGYG